MAMKRCPVCGEKYSDTYKTCPFCEEEAAARNGTKIRRGGKRSSSRNQPNLLTPTLVILILIMLALLVYLLFGDEFRKRAESLAGSQVEEVVPPDDSTGEESGEGETGMPEDPSVTDDATPSTGEEDDTTPTTGEMTYEQATALPDGLTLSTTDFTLKSVGESHTITVSGGSGSYTWISEDSGIASVDDGGKVTAVSNGTVNVVVTDGTKKGTCIVRCNVSAAASTATSNPGSGTTSSASGLKAGSAVVVNAGNGVFVRSGPGTSYEALATVSNGAEVKVVESAGGGWYKITFAGNGGADTTGYMKSEFLANQ